MNKFALNLDNEITLDGHVVATLTPSMVDSPILRERLLAAFKRVELPKIEEPLAHQA